MNTYSHTILTAVLKKPLDRLALAHPRRLPPLRTNAIIIGSFIPDLLLILISAVTILIDIFSGVFRNVDFSNPPADGPPPELLEVSKTAQLFDNWFFENPWVITAHNLFHSPLLLVCYLLIGYTLWKRGRQWGGWFFWLSCAAMLHTLIDIPLHVNDGPLLLYPLNWSWRFESPISYWDPNYYGREWSRFETMLNGVLLLFLLWSYRRQINGWFRRKFRPTAV